jgi:hypothetical protein
MQTKHAVETEPINVKASAENRGDHKPATTTDRNDTRENPSVKRGAFAVIDAVRDKCDLPDGEKLLMFTMATHCDRDGEMFAGNQKLATEMRKSKRTIQRMLSHLIADWQVQVIETGRGRDKKRYLKLTPHGKRDTARPIKGDTAMSCLNVTRLRGKAGCNSHVEQPEKRKKEDYKKESADVSPSRKEKESVYNTYNEEKTTSAAAKEKREEEREMRELAEAELRLGGRDFARRFPQFARP